MDPKVTSYIQQVLSGNFLSIGDYLISLFNLEGYSYSYIQKVINYPKPIYVITIDSRFSDTPITYGKIRSIASSRVGIYENIYLFKDFKLTPPQLLKTFKGKNNTIPEGSIIFVRDIGAEHYAKKELKTDEKEI